MPAVVFAEPDARDEDGRPATGDMLSERFLGDSTSSRNPSARRLRYPSLYRFTKPSSSSLCAPTLESPSSSRTCPRCAIRIASCVSMRNGGSSFRIDISGRLLADRSKESRLTNRSGRSRAEPLAPVEFSRLMGTDRTPLEVAGFAAPRRASPSDEVDPVEFCLEPVGRTGGLLLLCPPARCAPFGPVS
jgi:hypothetical protein